MWALGVILYEMITDERPFDADTVPSLIYKIVHTPMPTLDPAEHGLPIDVLQIIGTALQKEPDDRFSDLETMAGAIRAVLAGQQPGISGAGSSAATVVAASPQAVEPVAPVGVPQPIVPERQASLHSGTFRDAGVLANTGPLQVIAASPDERVLAIGGVDGAVQLWDLESRVSVRTLRSRTHLKSGHASLTTSLAFTSDGRLLATGHLDGSISVWDPESGFEMEATLKHDGAVGGLAFLPDGSILVSGGQDATLKYWRVAAVLEGEARRDMRRQPAEVTTLAVSREGELVISGHGNRNLRGHDTETGRLVATFHGQQSVPSAVAISQNGGLLACGGRDGSIQLYRVEGRAQLRHFEGHSKMVSSLVFFPDGRHAASVAMDSDVAIWGVSHEDRLATLSAGTDSSCASLVILVHSKRLICGLTDGQIRVWEFG
jgi:WD40 repeat protein